MKTTRIISTAVILCMLFSLVSCGLRDDTSGNGGAGRNTTAPEPTQTSEKNVQPDTSESEPDENGSGQTETNAVLPNQTESDTETVVPVPSGSIRNITDFSFLDSVPAGHFSDAAEGTNGSWYPGKATWDETTGSAVWAWDRAADTLALLDKYGAIYHGSASSKRVYLTFDCGYEYRNDQYPDGVTNAILDVLKEKNAVGTFFVTGDYLKSDSDIVERMLKEGQTVGSHTMHHYNMTTVTNDVFTDELISNNDLLKSKIPDAPDMIYYRPPEGGTNERTLALAREMGITTVLWSITQMDYDTDNQPDAAATLESDCSKLHPGAVYLLHAVSTTNAQILGDLIDYIRAQGFEISSLDDFER